MIYNLVFILIVLLLCYGIYKLFKKKRQKSQKFLLSEDELKPYLKDIDLPKEASVRKQWLISLFLISALAVFVKMLQCCEGVAFKELADDIGIALSILTAFGVSVLIQIPGFWITYHCSYKKRGTAWLMWIMIVLPIVELIEVMTGEWNASEWTALGWSLVVIFLGIEVFFWINCLRLRKVNADRKHQKLLALKQKYGDEASCS